MCVCGSTDSLVADCTTYKQGIKSLGYTPDEDELSQTEEHEFYSGLINKIGERCFSAIEKVTSECPLF